MTAPQAESPEARLAALGLTLPLSSPPLAAYRPAIRTGGHVYTAGQLPVVDGQLLAKGKVGAEVTAEEAAVLARTCVLNALAAVISVTGSLSAIRRLVKVTGFIACGPDFTAHSQVMNGASELLAEVFGEAGKHARSAVGMSSLPFDSPLEIELIAEVAD